jgi:hypothetical protein
LLESARLSTDPPTPTRSTHVGLFLIALATLTHQVLLTRIFSVTMWYHFAFLAISIAMFGMTAGALAVYLLQKWFPPEQLKTQLAVAALAYSIAIVLSFLTQLSVPFLVHPSVVAAYAMTFTVVVISVPFVISGACVSLALTQFGRRVSSLYAADLAGAAVGCLTVLALLSFTDAATAVVFVGALAGLGAIAFAIDAGRRRLAMAAAAVVVLFAAGAAANTVLGHRQFALLRILYIKGAFEARPLYEQWNSYSRVRVTGTENPDPEPPYGWGLSSTWPSDRLVRQLKMDIDVSAGTVMTAYAGDPASVEHLRYDVTNAGYYLRPGPAVAIVGVGGGRDLLSALSFGASRVTAIEINGNILRTVNERFGDFTGHLDRDPRVRFVNDEARSFVARDPGRYDVIQISLIDTWAATAAGAFVLSENAIYTREAWRTFLSRLTDTGVLSVSRWYGSDRPGEIYRMVALARAALLDAGIADARGHLLLVRNVRAARERDQPESIGTLLVSRSPFTAQDRERLRQVSHDLAFEVMFDGGKSDDAVLDELIDTRDLGSFTRAYPINIEPPTDDSPFFFQMLRLRDLGDVALLNAGKNKHNMQAVFVLGVLMATVLALGVVCVSVPRAFARPRVTLWPVRWPLTYFAAIGLGFMLSEIALMQRLILLLGHPTYGLSVVLFSLLLGGGAGSWLTRGVTLEAAPDAARRRLTLLVAVVAAIGLVTPFAIARLEPMSIGVRALGAGAVLFVAGLLMGQAFPLGLRLAAGHDRLTLWLWGVNGAMSVCASVLAIVIALSWSISAAYWTGAAAYGFALLAAVRIRAAVATAPVRAPGAAEIPTNARS